jgi:DNA-binding beta-propeller fold protein YncE
VKITLILAGTFFIAGFYLSRNIIGKDLKVISFLIDTPGQATTYSKLVYEESFVLPALSGVKSVLFNTAGTKLYAINLEGMSIYEFDRQKRKLLRKFEFKPSVAPGWDYTLKKPMPSFAEKPVEACFSHQDKILWVSLHNAGGIVPILLDSVLQNKARTYAAEGKVVYIADLEKRTTDTLYLPLVRTGIMPKVIAKTADNKFLLISNWGSKSLSVLKINDTLAPYGRKVATLAMSAVPRGIAIDNKNKHSFIGIMGGSQITVIGNKNWRKVKDLPAPANPRHLVLDSTGHLFVSFNGLSEIACIEARSGKILYKIKTSLQPRTIALSKNQQFIFVTCYGGNAVEVFKINQRSFDKVYAIKSEGKPVGVTLYEDDDKIEAWVCNYLAGKIYVHVFKKVKVPVRLNN